LINKFKLIELEDFQKLTLPWGRPWSKITQPLLI